MKGCFVFVNSDIKINGTFTIAGGASVTDTTPGSSYIFTSDAKVIVGGSWTITGGPSSYPDYPNYIHLDEKSKSNQCM